MWRKLRDDRWIFDAVSFRLRDWGRRRGGGMAETVGKISLQRRGTFYDSSAPRSFTVKSEQNSFYHGAGGKLVRCLRGAAVQNSRKQSSWCRHVSQSLLGMVALLFMGTCERFDVATISLAIVEKKMGWKGRFYGICWWFCWIVMGGEWYFEKIISNRWMEYYVNLE